MIKKILTPFLILQMLAFTTFSQTTEQEREEKEEALEKMEDNIDNIEDDFDDNREKLMIHDLATLKGLNADLEGLKHNLDSLVNVSDKVVDSAYQLDSTDTDNNIALSLDGEKFDIDLGDFGKDNPSAPLSSLKSEWLVLDLGFNNYLNDGDLDLPGKYDFLELKTGNSINVKLTIIKVGASLIDHHVSIMSGVGIDWRNYKFSNNTVITSSDADTLSTQTFSGGYKKYKLVTQYAFVPFELRFDTKPEKPEKSFHLSIGGHVGYLLNAHTKLKQQDGDKAKDFDDFQLREYKVGGVARIGFGDYLSLYANYDVTHLFEDNVGPGLNTVALGVTINSFQWK